MRHLAVLDAKTVSRLGKASNGQIYAVAVAKAIADCLPLPSSPVEDGCSSYFSEFIEPMAEKAVSFFNSARVMDVSECLAHVGSFWIGRYRTLYPMLHPEIEIGPWLHQAHFFGYGYHIPKTLLDFCIANAAELTPLANEAAKTVHQSALITHTD